MNEIFAVIGIGWAFGLGWMFGREHERRLLANRGPNWRAHLADDGTLWGELTNGDATFVGPCTSFDEFMAAIHAADPRVDQGGETDER